MTDEEVARHFPVMGWRMKCDNRTDLPKKQRVHEYVELGADARNSGTASGYIEGFVYACARCGTDKFSRTSQSDRQEFVRVNNEARARLERQTGISLPRWMTERDTHHDRN